LNSDGRSTPAFHHWHHTNDGPAYINKNYAPMLPWIDQIFGTLYLPKDKHPRCYGVDQAISPGLFGQLIQPFLPSHRFPSSTSDTLSQDHSDSERAPAFNLGAKSKRTLQWGVVDYYPSSFSSNRRYQLIAMLHILLEESQRSMHRFKNQESDVAFL